MTCSFVLFVIMTRGIILQFLISFYLFAIIIADDTTTNPTLSTENSVFPKDYIRNDDCNLKATEKSKRFLSLSQSQLTGKDLDSKTAGFEVDCSLRKTDVQKLIIYLNQKGFHETPGSLKFINPQDTSIRLSCSDGDIKDGKVEWSISGATTKVEADFNEKRYTGDTLIVESPADHLYFRKYTCQQTTKRCSHTFYVITRPQPQLNFPLQFAEGSEVEIKCSLNKCLVSECGEKIIPKSQPPYSFEWSVPKEILKVSKSTVNYTCKNGGKEDDKASTPIYVKFKPSKSKKPIPHVKLAKGVTMKISLVKANLLNETGFKFKKTAIQSKITIKDASDKHRGIYECIIIDGNGVPSIPTAGSLYHNTRYTGKSMLHIRSLIWLIIPAVLILLIILIMVLISLLGPLKMEHDDGTPYTKEELVTPSEPSSASTAPDAEPPIEPANQVDSTLPSQGISPAGQQPPLQQINPSQQQLQHDATKHPGHINKIIPLKPLGPQPPPPPVAAGQTFPPPAPPQPINNRTESPGQIQTSEPVHGPTGRKHSLKKHSLKKKSLQNLHKESLKKNTETEKQVPHKMHSLKKDTDTTEVKETEKHHEGVKKDTEQHGTHRKSSLKKTEKPPETEKHETEKNDTELPATEDQKKDNLKKHSGKKHSKKHSK